MRAWPWFTTPLGVGTTALALYASVASHDYVAGGFVDRVAAVWWSLPLALLGWLIAVAPILVDSYRAR